ncbi:MAG: hypothetical protein KF799_05305 [Bdellovibrionales bacterium]|nr:hypothetical protein [Bdellovibrionales bacterium]
MQLWLGPLLLLLTFFMNSAGAFEIPKGLKNADREEVVRILGLNSATKVLSNPYPLGGYSGFEIGYSVEFVNVRDIRRLGCQASDPGCPNTSLSDETEWRYSRITIGKGLYNDLDVFFSFVAPTGGVRLSDYGGMVRWSVYQAEFLPINVSLVAHGNQMNFNDSFVDRNLGGEIIVGVNVDNFALYFGGGFLESQGTFIGSTTGYCPATEPDCTADGTDGSVNPLTRTVTSTVRETHTVVGFSLHFENLFAAAQVDRYRDAVYSMKVGLRF